MTVFSLAQQSLQGGREYNEDRTSIFIRDDIVLLVLADGLGGHAGGAIASQALVDSVGETFNNADPNLLKNTEVFLKLAINHAHKMVHKRALENNIDVDSPKTTCVICLIKNGTAQWAHSGDSRLYLIRNRKVLIKTTDHVTRSANGSLPINRCVGGIEGPKPEASEVWKLIEGDVVMLASDGGWAHFTPELLDEYVDPEHPTLGISNLLNELENRNNPPSDNLSLVLLHWGAKQFDNPIINQAKNNSSTQANDDSSKQLFDMKNFDQKISEIEKFVNELDEHL